MYKTYSSSRTICLLLLAGLAGCHKPDNTCEDIQQVRITGAKASYYTGDTIYLSTNITPNALYYWHQTNSLNDISNTDEVFIPSCTKYDEGWYYLAVSNPD